MLRFLPFAIIYIYIYSDILYYNILNHNATYNVIYYITTYNAIVCCYRDFLDPLRYRAHLLPKDGSAIIPDEEKSTAQLAFVIKGWSISGAPGREIYNIVVIIIVNV